MFGHVPKENVVACVLLWMYCVCLVCFLDNFLIQILWEKDGEGGKVGGAEEG